MPPGSGFASALIAAHRGESSSLPSGAVEPPVDYVEAMRVQREVATALKLKVAGWKIGFAPDGTPVAGPLYASVMVDTPATLAMPERGFIVEIELAFRLLRDLPARAYTRDDILAATGEALIGVELIRGRRGEPPDVAFPAWLADNMGNAGYVTGGSTQAYQALELKSLPVEFRIDGELVEQHDGGHPQGDPVLPLRAYASQPNDALGGLKAGQLITTGSLTKPLRVDRPARIDARIGGIGTVTLTFTA